MKIQSKFQFCGVECTVQKDNQSNVWIYSDGRYIPLTNVNTKEKGNHIYHIEYGSPEFESIKKFILEEYFKK